MAVTNGSDLEGLIPPAHMDVNQGYGFLWIYLWANLVFSQDKAFVLGGMFIGSVHELLGEVPVAVLWKLIVNSHDFISFLMIIFSL